MICVDFNLKEQNKFDAFVEFENGEVVKIEGIDDEQKKQFEELEKASEEDKFFEVNKDNDVWIFDGKNEYDFFGLSNDDLCVLECLLKNNGYVKKENEK